MTRTGRLRVAVSTGFAGMALLAASQVYLGRRALGEGGTAWQAAGMGLASWGSWILATPLILWLADRFDFRPGRRLVSGLAHLTTAAACHIPSAFIPVWAGYRFFSPAAERPPSSFLVSQLLTSSRLQMSILVYGALLGAAKAVELWARLEERQLAATRAEGLAAKATLEALAARLQPHFLFNTLHTIGALIDENPALARRVVTQLGDLLRDVLEEGDPIVSLGQEIAWLERYLAIERTRFADRLTVNIEVAPEAAPLAVPRLLLQPLVENALRHGLARRGQGTVRVVARREADRLRIEVANDGASLDPTRADGIGLTTTRERLAVWAPDASVSIANRAEGGVRCALDLPARRLSGAVS